MSVTNFDDFECRLVVIISRLGTTIDVCIVSCYFMRLFLFGGAFSFKSEQKQHIIHTLIVCVVHTAAPLSFHVDTFR